MKHDDEACVKPDGPLSCFRVGDLCFTIWPPHGLVEVVEIDLEVASRGWAHIEALAIGDHPPAYQDGQTNQYYHEDLLPLELGGLVRNLTPSCSTSTTSAGDCGESWPDHFAGLRVAKSAQPFVANAVVTAGSTWVSNNTGLSSVRRLAEALRA